MKARLTRVAVAVVMAFVLILALAMPVSAAATVTPAGGGNAIAADDFGTGAWTTLTGPTIAETVAGEIGTGTIVFTVPAGFQFNPGQVVTATVTPGDITLESATATPTAGTITFTVSVISTVASTIVFSDIQVQPTQGTPLVDGDITNTGTAAGLPTPGAYGYLNEVHGALHHYNVVPAAGPYTAGTAFDVTITAVDQFDNPLGADYTPNEPYTWITNASDAPDSTPPDIGTLVATDFINGEATKSVTLYCAESGVTFTATDNSSITGTSAPITIDPGTEASFNVVTSGGGTEIAGVAFSVTLTALDAYGNIATGYAGATVSIDFTSTATAAPDATLPTIPTPQTLDFSVNPGIATATGFILVNASETPTITATDATISGTSAGVIVNPAAAASFNVVTSGGGTETTGVAFSVTLTALDAFGNTCDTGPNAYNSAAVSIDFTSTATAAPDTTPPTIPTPQTLDFSVTPGIATATGFILVNAGETPTITATDGTISGTSAAITVNAVINYYTVTSASYSYIVGAAFTVTVTAYDQYGNLVNTDSSTQVTMSSSSATMAFDGNGNGTFDEAGDDIKILSAGTFDIQARDTTAGAGVTITATDPNAKTGTSSAYTISALWGGGGGGVPLTSPPPSPPTIELELNLWGDTTSVDIDEDGVLMEGVTATSPDGMVTVTIAEGTQALGPDGNPLAELTVETILDPPDAPEGYHVIVAFDFGPDSTTCNPSIEITIEYDPDALPEGVDEANLVIAYYDEAAGEWAFVPGEVDTVANTVTFSAGHFTTFAVLAAAAPEVVPTPAPSPTSEGGLSGGTWAGIGIGIAGLIGLSIGIILRRRS